MSGITSITEGRAAARNRCLRCSQEYNPWVDGLCPRCGSAAARILVDEYGRDFTQVLLAIHAETMAAAAEQPPAEDGEQPPAEAPPSPRLRQLRLWRYEGSEATYTYDGGYELLPSGEIGALWVEMIGPGLSLECDGETITGLRDGRLISLALADLGALGLLPPRSPLLALAVLSAFWARWGAVLHPGRGLARLRLHLSDYGILPDVGGVPGYYIDGVSFSVGGAEVRFSTSDTYGPPDGYREWIAPSLSINGYSQASKLDFGAHAAAEWVAQAAAVYADQRVVEALYRTEGGKPAFVYQHPHRQDIILPTLPPLEGEIPF